LGYIISPQEVATDPDKVQIIANWPVPTSVKELRSFLGLAGYYRKFVKHFGVLSKPLTHMLRKGELFVWTQEQTESFEAIKRALIIAPILALPDFSLPFVMETDTSDKGIRVVLQQMATPLLIYVRL
jgi:hypothetical protein